MAMQGSAEEAPLERIARLLEALALLLRLVLLRVQNLLGHIGAPQYRPPASNTVRSTAFSNCRTLPGHG